MREFCEMYKDKVKDYNMGTLMRARADGDFGEDNCCMGKIASILNLTWQWCESSFWR